MNQGRIWCVVNPTVGLPLFLGSVAVTSFIVHTAVMTHTTWMSTYWQGARARMADAAPAPAVASTGAYSVTVTPVAAAENTPASFTIAITPQTEPSAAPAAFRAASAE